MSELDIFIAKEVMKWKPGGSGDSLVYELHDCYALPDGVGGVNKFRPTMEWHSCFILKKRLQELGVRFTIDYMAKKVQVTEVDAVSGEPKKHGFVVSHASEMMAVAHFAECLARGGVL